jgi:3-dehydroquinate synthase
MNSIFPDSTQFFTGKKSIILLKEFIKKELQPDKIFILTDENTNKFCLKPFKKIIKGFDNIIIIIIASGEQNKTLASCETIWSELAHNKATRKSLIINLGGGMISDIGGFVASTYKRGLKYINIPTTLLSQVDASVGGKTGIDFKGVKNMLGVFSFPEAILIYPPFIETLDERQKKSGYAEIIKTALACDKSFWQQLSELDFNEIIDWQTLINRTISIKLQVVNADPFESGFRKVLNFGHTIGHAFESYSMKHDNTPLLHGEAVAMGMLCETMLSNKISGLKNEETKFIIDYLLKNFNYYSIKLEAFPELFNYIFQDKKNEADEFQFTLLSSPGRAVVNQKTNIEIITQCLKEYINLKVEPASENHFLF